MALRQLRTPSPRRTLLLLLAACVLQHCGSSEPAGPPPPNATYAQPIVSRVRELDEYPGRLESPQFATVSARVSGIIERAPFQEGALVSKGDVLFEIDTRPFLADKKSKEADLSRAHAQLAQADAQMKRYNLLQGTKAISAQDFDQALAAQRQAKADVAVAEAALDVAALNLEWTKVIAPISGRVSKKLITEGNLVNGVTGLGIALTTITSVDPIYCSVTIPERALSRYRSPTPGAQADARSPQIPCAIQLENENTYHHEGYIDFLDNRVNPGTGTVELRCRIPNADGALTPGLFSRLRIPGSAPYETVLIPDTAIGTDQNSRFVLVINKEDTVETRQVMLGALLGKLRAIKQGLSKDDRIILTGTQQLRPGTKVTPQSVNIPTDSLTPFLVGSEQQPLAADTATESEAAKKAAP